MAKTGRKAVLKQLGHEFRSWRGSVSRKTIALSAGIPIFVVCVVEHGRAHQVRFEDLVKLVSVLDDIKERDHQTKAEFRKLFSVLAVYKAKQARRCHCHKTQKPVRR